MNLRSELCVIGLVLCLFGIFWIIPSGSVSADDQQTFFVSQPVRPGISPAVRDLPPESGGLNEKEREEERENPLKNEPDHGQRGTWNRKDVPLDPLALIGINLSAQTPAPELTFEGTSNPFACNGCSPPDTNGDSGPNHYIQIVNATKVAIYDKNGTLLKPAFNLGTLWTSGTCTSNAGDPVALYDGQADRWFLSQFASPSHMCIAISQTADPTGTYFTYTFNVGSFPDYFKFGVWPDGYYMSANESTYTAYAFDRAKMLAGTAATFQKFTGGTNFYMASDLDGSTPPPAGAPNYFYTFKDNSFHGGVDRIEIREFHVDFVTPANSTFTLTATLNIAPFTYTVCGFFNFNCVAQMGTNQKVDVVSEWPMFHFPYRNFGDHESLVGVFTIGGSINGPGGTGEVGAASRWFELRKIGAGSWTLFQEGTFDPPDGHDRFMGSISMDSSGNIALGYSASSSAIFPSIRYATRLTTDPVGTLQTEQILQAGGGSQTGSNRWGDYSAMSSDPSDNCHFWYTNEYYSTNSFTNWKTKIGKFSASGSCGGTNVLFFDDFEDGILSDQWTYVGTWSETGGALVGTFTTKGTAIASPAFAGCSLCTIKTNMSTAGGGGSKVSFLGWYTNNQNNVEVVMNEASNKWIIQQRVAGSVVDQVKVNSTIDPNVNYEVQVSFDGTDFTLTVNGNPLATLTATGSPTGTVGFVVGKTTGTFADVQATSN